MKFLVTVIATAMMFLNVTSSDQKTSITVSVNNVSSNSGKVSFALYNQTTFIVYINALKDIVSYSNSRLKLVLHSYQENEIIVSRERVKDFKNWFIDNFLLTIKTKSFFYLYASNFLFCITKGKYIR